MATTVANIISDAFRENNLTAVGTTATTAEVAEALVLLNRFLASLFGHEMGDNLTNVGYGTNNVLSTAWVPQYYNNSANDYLPPNTRLLCNLTAPSTVILSPNPHDGARMQFIDTSGNGATNTLTVNGNGRILIGSSTTTILNTNSYNTSIFYRADLGSWMKNADLILTDVSPFPEEFDDLLIIGLAERLNPRNGVEMPSQTIDRWKRIRTQFFARYTQVTQVGSEPALQRLYGNKYYRMYPGYTKGSFERGDTSW